MEIAGLGIGSASLLIGFKGATDGLVLLSEICHGFDDASFYAAKLAIETERLRIWGQFFGFGDDDECGKLLAQPVFCQSLVLYILKEFEDATTNLQKLDTKYGIRLVEKDDEVAADVHMKSNLGSELLAALVERQAKFNSKLKWWKKGLGLQWVLEAPKFDKLLDRLEYLNDSLEKIVPRVDLALLTQGLASFLVPTHDRSYLDAFQQSSQVYLAMCAAAKEIKLNASHVGNVPTVQIDLISSPSVLQAPLADGSSRMHGMYQTPDAPNRVTGVIVDWKVPNLDLDLAEADEVFKRIRTLCLLFRRVSQNSSSAFRILPCLGLTKDPSYPTPSGTAESRNKYGFVFECPIGTQGKPESLFQSYSSLKNVPIGHRFRLAQNLASGLLLLHSSKWLHKNICSQNITVFPRSTGDPYDAGHLTAPYFTGFAYSRPDELGEKSMERPQKQQTLDYYRHPDFKGRYSRLNDIYSLGVVLFEIGNWQSIGSMCDGYGLHYTSESQVRDLLLLENCKKGSRLRARMGDVYVSVVQRCLSGDFGVSMSSSGEGELVKAFWSHVVRDLDSCRA